MDKMKKKTISAVVQNGVKYYIWGYFERNQLLIHTYIDSIIEKNEKGEYIYHMILRKKNSIEKKSRDDEIVLNDIEYKSINYLIYISEEYFNNVILPLDKE